MIQACILDMDGVIVDTEAFHIESFRRFLKEKQVGFTEEFIESFVGYSIYDNILQINKQLFGGKELDVENSVTRRNDIYLNLLTNEDLTSLPGILELISHCQKNNLKLALTTSAEWRQVETIMSRISNNYKTLFDVIVTGDDVKNKKPAPDIYFNTVEKLKLPAQSCIAFEDSRAGVESAVAAGITCFAIRNRYFDDIQLKKANRIINSVKEALENNFWR